MPLSLHPSILLLSEDACAGAHAAQLLIRAGLEFRAAHALASEHVAFAQQANAIIVLVPRHNAVVAVQQLIARGIENPILVLMPNLTNARRAMVLEHGAAACHGLPMTAQALVAALEPLHHQALRNPSTRWWFDATTYRAGHGDTAVRLSPCEFALLRCLASHAGHPVSAERLKADAWGQNLPQRSQHQIVAVLMCRLRKKLAQVGYVNAVTAVRGAGYAFQPERVTEA